ncbi:MAG: protein kinase [bacterium]|nr:protein kinase [bacterium]
MSSPPHLPARYKALRLLGEGGAGRVWLVEDTERPGRRLALKELLDAERARSLRHEFATLTRLRHPNLVRVFDFELEPHSALPFFTLEYVDGVDLAQAVAGGGPEAFLDLTAEALRALDFLHHFGVVHRDLKPANLLVRERPRLGCRLVVLDFGLALGDVQQAEGDVPTAGGTLPYIAPELFEGSRPDPRSDLYALGAVLFESLHGATPFRLTEDVGSFIQTVRDGRRARPAAPADFPSGVAGWLEELLSPDPALRPGSASEALARFNAACDVSYPAETGAGRAARLASGAPPGREPEIEALWSALAPSDEPRLVWLAGGPGSGKRRMLRWLGGDALARGWEVFHLRDAGEDANARLRDYRRSAAEKPTLVLVPEVDAAGSHVVEFLERVAREGRQAPLRVVAALTPGRIRAPALQRLLEHTGRVPTLRRVDLTPLDAPGLSAMIVRATGAGSVAGSRLKWLADASEGHPQTAEALLVEGVWESGGRASAASASIADLLNTRLELLSSPAVALLEALAAYGRAIPVEPAAALAGLELDAARDAGAELSALDLARDEDGGLGVESRQLGAIVLQGIERERKADLFRRAAEWAESDDSCDTASRARLWSGAGDAERAVGLALHAAQAAARDEDPLLEADSYAFALRQFARRDPRRLDLRMAQAKALHRANLAQAAARALGAALRLADSTERRADILARQGVVLMLAGRFDRARETADEALALAHERNLPEIEARARQVIGSVLARTGRGEEALPYLVDAVDAFARAGERFDQAHALQALALCEVNEGAPGAREHFERAIELFQELDARGKGLINSVGLAVIEQRTGKYDAAWEMLDETRRIAASSHNLLIEGVAAATLAQASIFVDRHADAVAFGLEAENQGLHLGDDRLRFGARAARAQALVRCNRPAEALELLESMLAAPHERVDPVMVEYVRLARIEAAMAIDGANDDGLAHSLRASLETTRKLNDPDTLLWALALEAERAALRGDVEALRSAAGELDGLADRGAGWDQPAFALRVGLARAKAAADGGRADEEIDLSRSALESAQAHGLPSLGARAAVRLSAAHRAAGDLDAADAARARGRELLDRAASRIDDAELRRGLTDHPHLAALRAEREASSDRRLLALYDMINALNSNHDPDDLLSSILVMALDVVSAERGMILLRNAATGGFEVALSRNLDDATIDDAGAVSRHVVAEAGEGRSVLAIDAAQDVRFCELTSVTRYGIHSLMCVPLRSRGRLIGAVYLDNRMGGRTFTEGDLRFLEAFADHAGLALDNARARRRLERENRKLQQVAERRAGFGNLVGDSPAMRDVFALIKKTADSDLPVLIQGESGTGKELVARAIHFNSPRRKQAYVTENCAAIPETLLQSELFGHVRGAFSGADRDRAGLFEHAHGGSLFLDEVGEMSPGMQAQLLRTIQEGTVRRVGADTTTRVDVRVVAATNRRLQEEVAAGRFREDLFYRLQVLVIDLPPLRERPGDLSLLIDHFLRRIAEQRQRPLPVVDEETRELLETHAWPGNVRQLENCLQRLSLLAGDDPITRGVVEMDVDLNQALLGGGDAAPTLTLQQSERERIAAALRAAGGNRSRAARLLGISRATIYRKLREYRL